MSENLINIAPIDRFSALHFAAGYLIGLSKMPVIPAVILGLLWEWAEPELKMAYPQIFPNPVADSQVNKIFDTIIYTIGIGVGRR